MVSLLRQQQLVLPTIASLKLLNGFLKMALFPLQPRQALSVSPYLKQLAIKYSQAVALNYNNNSLQNFSAIKFLGLHLNAHLSWESHVDVIWKKLLPITSNRRSFEVDYENDQFLKDGQPFRYVSGSLHYFRVPREYWQDRLRKLRAAGLNVVSTYIEWSRHEPRRGQYDFTGDNDIEHFIKLAEQEGLLVILRPGPYICAERDLGGYPPWILHENPKMILRTNDSSHTHHVRSWLEVFLQKIQPYLYGNGGPVIMVQKLNAGFSSHPSPKCS
ncbi:hypothetical protein J6590_085695 [Homalodisca vitripennis]|nr:hypothetical protein J6590_085695 [Homalodisca vitripennis]